ncbi:MAG TPA: methylenetetrahydrofolate reductase [NAD(P)H] [Clostridiaceae bacterium]|nr:methylenetetrahydrofolate reductase [NAD(P)H] [Clostridiaceae bacterium]
MKLSKLFKEKKVVYSFEIFPPKLTSPIKTVFDTIDELSTLAPDYISVTYGAGGNLSNDRTTELASLVKNKYGIEALAHLTCIGSTRSTIDTIVKGLRENGVENLLALRGDVPVEKFTPGDFKYANELIAYLKQTSGMGISAACYPEGHTESRSMKHEMDILKLKADAGAEHFTTQLFFDNNHYYEYINKAEQKNIKVPIQAGIMPVTNRKQIERTISMCGAAIPKKFLRIMDRYGHDPVALREAGIAFALDQIVDLISSGAPGVHLYTMNNPYVARKITENIAYIRTSLNKAV